MTNTVCLQDSHGANREIEQLLASEPIDPLSERPLEIESALRLARALCRRAQELQSPSERRQQAELDRLIRSSHDKATLIQLTDQAFRTHRAQRVTNQLVHILDVQGIPRFFGAMDRALLHGFQSFGPLMPRIAVPFVKERMRHDTANVILPAEPEHLEKHLRARWKEGVRMNVNYLGEALLGEGQAMRRLQGYLKAIQDPHIEVISVKISTIYSQISATARQHVLNVLCDRLEILFRAAAAAKFVRCDGTVVQKLVYLDMEEYRDKEITADAFMRTLDRPGLELALAGIALKAYLPDSYGTQQRLIHWARNRVAKGGAPITMRLVKGANMEAECVEASLRGWPQAPYKSKVETDANYLRMLREGLRTVNLPAVRLGIASHNLFTLSYGLVMAAHAGALDQVQFEMLEGMASHQMRALSQVASDILLYAPACRQEDFSHAIGYLIRRMDENSGSDNFLRYAFKVVPDSSEWRMLEEQFLDALERLDDVSAEPRRKQDRRNESYILDRTLSIEVKSDSVAAFKNEADTDWSLPQNCEWAESILTKWHDQHGGRAADIPLVIDGIEIPPGPDARYSHDPSRPGTVVARFRQANETEVDRAVAAAYADANGWRRRSMQERHQLLHRVATEICAARGDLMGAMLAESGKTLTESDPEVSEAVDFCRFYADSALDWTRLSGLSVRGRGVVVVISPWNFPLAIPCGGIAAALAAGNTVLLKPATDTTLIAYLLSSCFWRAGVPQTALQFVPCSGGTVGQRLATHRDVDVVVLTGGTSTAAAMLAAKPTMNLLAETGGKNATIVTALSDRELAIKNILHSAFSHSGQKCSATSLLILEREVFHDRLFRETLCDAVTSLQVGSAWNLSTTLSPLIRPPQGDLERGLKLLEPGEEWAVMPRFRVDGNSHLVSPGVKWNVPPQGFTHCTELFGPVLGVMESRDLDHAIDLANATGYGLTSGLESLDQREHERWLAKIRAGNLYINRPTTGAIVLRQPFGGTGKSAIGPGIKAGGPNYVVPLMEWENVVEGMGQVTAVENNRPVGRQQAVKQPRWRKELAELNSALKTAFPFESAENAANITAMQRAINSYVRWAEQEFRNDHDHFWLLGEDNLRRYVPVEPMRIRVNEEDSIADIILRAVAAWVADCNVMISIPKSINTRAVEAINWFVGLTRSWSTSVEVVAEDDIQIAEAIRTGRVARVRYASPSRVPTEVRTAAAEALQYIADAAVSSHGRLELIWYFREQSISYLYHRYGNLHVRAEQSRDVPA